MDQPTPLQPDISAPPAPQPEMELIRWMGMSRPYRPLDRQLFATALVIIILVSIIAAFAGEWMSIAVLAAIVFAYYVWSTVPPEKTDYVITSKGIRMHGQIYVWSELVRWWIDEKWGHSVLVVDAPASFPKRLHLILEDVNIDQLKQIMARYVVEEKPQDTSIDKASRWLAEKFPLTTH